MPSPSHRTNERFAGAMFLVAIVASLAGGTLIQGVLDQPGFMSQLPNEKSTIAAGVALEVVNALAVIGIAAALWAPLRLRFPAMTAGYLGVRGIEAMVCALAAFLPVALLGLADNDAGADDLASPLTALRDSLLSSAVPVFFGVSAATLYLMLYRAALVPRYIPIWGLIGAVAIVANVFAGETAAQPLLALPIITNEIYLGVYLLTKGLRPAAAAPGRPLDTDSARTVLSKDG